MDILHSVTFALESNPTIDHHYIPENDYEKNSKEFFSKIVETGKHPDTQAPIFEARLYYGGDLVAGGTVRAGGQLMKYYAEGLNTDIWEPASPIEEVATQEVAEVVADGATTEGAEAEQPSKKSKKQQ